MNNIVKITLAIIASLAFIPAAKAQSDSNVYNERVVVTSRYKPVVEETQKINVAPTITDTVATMPKSFTYDISTRRLTSLYEPSRIKAARIIGEPATKLYNNYIKLGFGNYLSPLAEVYFNSLRSPDKTYGIRATHRSSWGTIGRAASEDEPPSSTHYGQAPFSLTDITAFGKLITKSHHQLSADLGYQNDFNRYYGFSDSTLHSVMGLIRDSVKKPSYRASYNTVAANFGLKTLNTDVRALGYEANVNVTDLFASYNQNEFNINFDGNMHYGFMIAQKHKAIAYLHLTYNGYINNFNPTELPFGADSTLVAALPVEGQPTTTSTLSSHSYLGLYKANPYIDFIFSGFQIHAGAVIMLDGYNHPGSGKVHVFPDATVGKSFFNDLINATLEARGNMDANSWNYIRTINPYIAPNSPVRATGHFDLAAKVRLNLSKKIDINLYGIYSNLNDDLSFRLDDRYHLNNVFTPVYDSLIRIKLGGSFVFLNDEMLRLEAKGNYYIYRNKKPQLVGDKRVGLPLYYRPDFDAGICATVNYNDKVIGRLELQLLGRTPYTSVTNTYGVDSTLYLPLRYGLNMEVEYRHNKALSFFLKADNLLFQRYYYWQNYPSYRALFLIGLTYTIPN
ncbi:MAG: hypothetical protein IKH97_04275 [Bacteroidales bacterium]|nr:hypothetical protein [Bacteroidales bacterium]